MCTVDVAKKAIGSTQLLSALFSPPILSLMAMICAHDSARSPLCQNSWVLCIWNYDDQHVCVCVIFFSFFFRLTAFSFCFSALVCRSTYGRNDRLLHRAANHNRIQHETQKVDREQSKEASGNQKQCWKPSRLERTDSMAYQSPEFDHRFFHSFQRYLWKKRQKLPAMDGHDQSANQTIIEFAVII